MGHRPILALGFALGILLGDAATGSARSISSPQIPLAFEANAGQTDPEVKFLARGAGYGAFLTPTGVVLALPAADKSEPAALRIAFAGARRKATLTGLDELPGKANYFTGSDPARWRRDVPTFARVRARQVYRGVDVVYYASQSRLEFDFVVAQGADPSVIALAVEGAGGIEIAPDGDLIVRAAGGSVRLQKPVVYQDVDGVRREVPGGYRLDGQRRVRFQLAAYDRARPVVIDPVLSYSSYLGGSDTDQGQSVAVDAAGFVYLTGDTASPNFPMKFPMQPTRQGFMDAFVTKLAPDGHVVYSTYLGGSSVQMGLGIAADRLGNAYVAGWTASANFPTLNAFQPAMKGPSDAFVVKLDRKGGLAYSTFLGGTSGPDAALGIGVDGRGSAIVTGYTSSVDFPVQNPLQHFGGGLSDAFVTKLDPSGASLVYSTFLGGSDEDRGHDIAVDADGSAWVTGSTASWNFPLSKPVQGVIGGGYDAFVAKLDPRGATLIYSTFLGGGAFDAGNAIAIDPQGNAYVAGETSSSNFPTANPLQGTLAGTQDAFVAKLDRSGTVLLYSTYLGGSSWDAAWGIAADRQGNAYVLGNTNSTTFPTVNPIQATYNGGFQDSFVAKLNAAGSALVYSTYLGGSGGDGAGRIAVDAERNVWVTGYTSSLNFPTVNALQPLYQGGTSDGFVSRLTDVFAYVANYGGSSVSVMDIGTNVPASPISLPPGAWGVARPWGAAVTPDGAWAFVTDAGAPVVRVVDTQTLAPTFVSVTSPSMGVAISPDGSLAFVTDLYTASVTVIDVPSKTVITTAAVGAYPVGVAFAPDGATAYVANAGDNSVSVLAIWHFWPWFTWVFEIARIPVGQTPYGVAVSPHGFVVYVTNLGDNSVSVIDTTRLVEVARVPVGNAPRGVAMAPTGTRAYVANSGTNDVSVLETLTHGVLATINVGYAPEGVAVSPGATRVYVTNFGSSSVSVIDTATNSVVATPAVGLAPAGIAVTP